MGRLLSQSQFARRQKVSRSMVNKWIREGKIFLIDGKIDPTQAEKDLYSNVDRSRRLSLNNKPIRRTQSKMKARSETPSTETFLDVRKRHETAKAQLAELKLRLETGDLVLKDQAEKWLFGHVDEAKNAFWGLPQRMGPVLAPVSDQKEIEFILRKEIREILMRLASPGGQAALEVLDEGSSPSPDNESFLKESGAITPDRGR